MSSERAAATRSSSPGRGLEQLTTEAEPEDETAYDVRRRALISLPKCYAMSPSPGSPS